MKYYSEKEMKEIRSVFEKKVLSWPHVTQNTTFGCPSYQAEGKTFAILVTKGVLITKIDQAIEDTQSAPRLNETKQTKQRNIEHWVRVPITDENEMEQIFSIVKKSSEIVLQEEQDHFDTT
ncbi:MAG: hypothetical protein M8352_04030 [ANME-2 cluster archaeon]|nr:hypothetical protein [ANME-2 cluster archaeon]